MALSASRRSFVEGVGVAFLDRDRPLGALPQAGAEASQRFSATSRALPSTIWIAPSAQLGTHSPQPLHLSASISTILRFIFSLLPPPAAASPAIRSEVDVKAITASGARP